MEHTMLVRGVLHAISYIRGWLKRLDGVGPHNVRGVRDNCLIWGRGCGGAIEAKVIQIMCK